MNIIFWIGLMFLSFLVLRALIGIYTIAVAPNIKLYLKIWNAAETLMLIYTYIRLVIYYFHG